MILNCHFNSFIYFLKGVIWLVLGFAVEVPPLVSTDVLSFPSFSNISSTS